MKIVNILEEKLFLGNYLAAYDNNKLKKYNIKGILDCTPLCEVKNKFESEFNYNRRVLYDSPHPNLNPFPLFKAGIEIIERHISKK